MDAVLPLNTWLGVLAVGCLSGAVGQMVRQIAGLKKVNDTKDPGQGLSDVVDSTRLVTSLLIGATAGALCSLTLSFDPAKMSGQTILALVTSGYAGADFIEAFMSKRVAPVTPHE